MYMYASKKTITVVQSFLKITMDIYLCLFGRETTPRKQELSRSL